MRSIIIPQYLKVTKTASELYFAINELIKKHQISKLLLCCGEYSMRSLIAEFKTQIKIPIDIINPKLNDISPNKDYEWVVGIGGGAILDHAKFLATQIGAKFISIPTLVSHDGISSPVAVINGSSLAASVPFAVFAPLNLIKESSLQHIQSGIGDLISNLSAIEDWKLANQERGEAIDDFSIMLSKDAAQKIIFNLEKLMLQKIHPETALYNEEFLESLVESLCLSGIAMSIAGSSRPCSGAEHLISHAIDKTFGHGVKSSHGIQVLIATLFLEKFRNNEKRHSKLLKIMKYFKFPISFEEIGITDLNSILELAPQTRTNRFTILNLKKSV